MGEEEPDLPKKDVGRCGCGNEGDGGGRYACAGGLWKGYGARLWVLTEGTGCGEGQGEGRGRVSVFTGGALDEDDAKNGVSRQLEPDGCSYEPF